MTFKKRRLLDYDVKGREPHEKRKLGSYFSVWSSHGTLVCHISNKLKLNAVSIGKHQSRLSVRITLSTCVLN